MKSKYFILALCIPFCITGCEDDPDNPDLSDSNVVIIDDDISEVTSWSGDSVYIIKKYDFYVENTLTIEAGAVIKFHPTEGPYMMLGGSGTVIANGTVSKPIIFTSYKDDEHGGDSNGDEDASEPAAKDWGEINTNDMNGSRFSYCEFYYGGNSIYNATLTIYGANIHVKNCLFVNNDGGYGSSAGDIGVLDATNAGSGTLITNNIFYNNKRPLSVNTAFDLDDSNIFHNPADAEESNTYNGIFVETIDDIAESRSWSETEVAFVIDDNDWWIYNGATLILANDVVLKFKSDSEVVLDDGSSSISNYNGSGVFFTSYKDDTHKGDTNGDGNATQAGAGDWNGIYDNQTSGYVTWTNILYN